MRFWRVTAALVVLVVLMLLYVWRTEHAQVLAAEAQQLRKEHQRLSDQLDQARARRTALSSVSRIKQLATERLGLVEPEELPVVVPAIEGYEIADSTKPYTDNPERDNGSSD